MNTIKNDMEWWKNVILSEITFEAQDNVLKTPWNYKQLDCEYITVI